MALIDILHGNFALVDDNVEEFINEYCWYAGKNLRVYRKSNKDHNSAYITIRYP